MAENELKIILTGDPSGIEQATAKASKALNNVKQASGSAQFALTNLSRVASDAPFGFIAIQNNLDPLIQSFGQLKAQTGSVGGALKSLAAGLAGPAGLAVGFSVVSALVTTAIQNYGSLGAAIEAITSGNSALAISQKKVTDEFAKSDAAAKVEIGNLDTLIKIYDDVNTTEKGRQTIMKDITSEYAKYLPNLDKEKITIDDIRSNYNNLSKTLIDLGRVKALNKLIDDQTLATEKLRAQSTSESVGVFDQLKNTFLSFGNIALASSKNATTGVINQAQAIKESESITASYREELFKLEQTLANKGITETKVTESAKKHTKAIKEQKEEIRITADYWRNLADTTTEVENKFSKGTTSLFGKGGNGVLKQIEQLQAAGQAVQTTFDNLSQSIVNTLAPAFTTAFDSIVSGSQNAFQAFGQAIIAIIKKMVVAAATAALLSFIINTALPGIGLTKAANPSFNFATLFGQFSGFKMATGGIVTGPTRALIGESGPEAVIPLNKLESIVGGNQNIFVQGVLSGETIYLQQQRTSARRARFA